MANYYGTTRTNYFAVKDEAAFREELADYPVEIITQTKDGVTLFGFIDDGDDGDVSSYYDETGEDYDLEWADVFARHLADDWVAVVISSGAEKHRYITGYANAYNSKGECLGIDLSDIYFLARDLGSNLTSAEY